MNKKDYDEIAKVLNNRLKFYKKNEKSNLSYNKGDIFMAEEYTTFALMDLFSDSKLFNKEKFRKQVYEGINNEKNI